MEWLGATISQRPKFLQLNGGPHSQICPCSKSQPLSEYLRVLKLSWALSAVPSI